MGSATALTIFFALIAAHGAVSQTFSTPYDYISAQSDMKILKSCVDNILVKNQGPWKGTKRLNFTIYIPTDELPGNCPDGCKYDTMAGGKNLVDRITIDVDEEVGTYLVGGSNDDYADYVSRRFDVSVNGRMLHTIDGVMIQARFIPVVKSPPPPVKKSSPPPPPKSSPPPPWTCFFPNDNAAAWYLDMTFQTGTTTLLAQTIFINGCWQQAAAGRITDARCPNATREYVGVVQNLLMQHCVDRTNLPQITTIAWANTTYATVLPFGSLNTTRINDTFTVRYTNSSSAVVAELLADTPALRARDNVVAHMNAGLNAVRRLNETDNFAWETALGQKDTAGLSVVKTPFSGNCSDNSTVGPNTGVPLKSMGYCSQCFKVENTTDVFVNCSFTVYSILTAYKFNLSTSPPNASSLAFATTPFCSGDPKIIRGPVPVGIPDIVTKQSAMLYIVDDVLIFPEALQSGVVYTPTAAGCAR
ncbi:hypothetical protein GPECTOR_446g336 [Gonium pectorale]|uniref:Pherophorin domain-containing protein n=1 Tax=Gonium pectorale TaxID=33097 RepID=A0A150FV43_GONPE|nr:hypothetical protein GPECTOR_446g336 [Gonium pectorale]|eukprot:KXZ41476.1 hypothetical protein GPECTOR_446g336 [Gonium pectorale]